MHKNGDYAIHLNASEATRALMRLVLDHPELQARLGQIIVPEQFELEMQSIASEHGLKISLDELTNMSAPDSLGRARWQPAPIVASSWPSTEWIPTSAVPKEDTMEFDWFWMGTAKTDQPFFEDSVRQANSVPFNRAFRTRTGLEALIAGADHEPTVPLAGFIFHMSRCGSTLLGRMLGAVPHHLVVSEPEPLDTVIQWAEASSAPYETKLRAIRSMVAALGRRRNPEWQRFFVKLNAWHILSHGLIRDAFPDVPWVFLHRDPVEVMVSHLNMPGIQAVPGMLPNALVQIENAHELSQKEYIAVLLARLCAAAIEHMKKGGGMVIDYDNLLAAAQHNIPRHFGFRPDAIELAAMQETSTGHSKYPSAPFSADSQSKQAKADTELRELVNRIMQDLPKQLKLLSSVSANQ